MPLVTKNIVVGVSKAPTTKQEKQVVSKEQLSPKLQISGEFINQSAKPEPAPVIKKVEPSVLKDSRYMQKEDGELVRHINTKSQYLKDILEEF